MFVRVGGFRLRRTRMTDRTVLQVKMAGSLRKACDSRGLSDRGGYRPAQRNGPLYKVARRGGGPAATRGMLRKWPSRAIGKDQVYPVVEFGFFLDFHRQ